MAPTEEDVTVSTVTTTATTGCHMLKIDGYTRITNMHRMVGHFVESSKFKVAGHTWSILCYPNGRMGPGFISVSLKLHNLANNGGATSLASKAEAEVRFSLVPQHHLGVALPLGTPHEKSFMKVFYPGSMEVLDRFVVRKELEKSWYLKDDRFAIRCDIVVVNKLVVKEPVVRPTDLERLGMVCKCNDDLCTLHHTLSFTQVAKLKFLELFFGCFQL
uniref:MATH domain-containing protein n=1 Tax=Oryza punctata TaxID=4537 RepID=A0A0E0MFB4_ORYPU